MAEGSSLFRCFMQASVWIRLRLAVIFLLGIAVVCTSSLMIYEIWKASAQIRRPVQPVARMLAEAQPLAITYELRNVSLSLSDRSGSRSGYAQFTLVFDLPSAEARRWCELNRAQMIHILLEEGASFKLEDFDTARGYELLKKSLVRGYAEKFKEFAPRSILIKDFTTH